MTPSQAAEVIGCCASHVRTLIRKGKLQAKKVPAPYNPMEYRYEVSPEEALRYRDKPQTVGFPRGQSRNNEER